MKIDGFIKAVNNSVEVLATVPLQDGYQTYIKLSKKEIKAAAKEIAKGNPDAEFNAEFSKTETGKRKTLYID